MSGRPWVQLSTRVYTDPKMIKLPRDVFGNFCMMLAMAGANDDGGRLGPPDEVAMMLHVSEAELSRAVEALGGRIRTDRAGCLWVRDWAQWQPPTTAADRARKARDAARLEAERLASHGPGDAEQPPQAGANVAATLQQRPTNEHVARKNQELNENQETTTSGTAPAAPPPASSPPPDPWAVVYVALADLYGGVPWRDKRTGDRLAWVGQSTGILGKHGGSDPPKALEMVGKFKASGRVKFAPKPRDLPPVLGQWCEEQRPARTSNGFAFDDRFHYRTERGQVGHKAPALVKYPPPYSPHDPATWPPEMRAAYVGRIHQTADGEVFA